MMPDEAGLAESFEAILPFPKVGGAAPVGKSTGMSYPYSLEGRQWLARTELPSKADGNHAPFF